MRLTPDLHGLDRLLGPKRIALLGATINPKGVGATVLCNLLDGRFPGPVHPIHPTAEALHGVPCFPSLEALPHPPDLAIVAAPAAGVPDLVGACGERGVGGVIVLSAGFGEAGPEGRAHEERLRSETARFPGMRVLGPNCLGVVVPRLALNASFGPAMPEAGSIAFLSQSGALCASVLDWAREERIGFSHFVSIGNALDVDFADLIDYLGQDDETSAIVLYVESIRDARRFLSAARAFACTKPIVVHHAGRSREGARASASHTGAMTTEADVFQAAFRRAGLARVLDVGQVFDCVELIGRGRRPRGKGLAIVTNAGGPGVMAADALAAAGGPLAELSDATRARLAELLPPIGAQHNPVDVLGDAPPRRVARAVEAVLADAGVDAVLAILTPQAMTDAVAVARALAALADTSPKPVLATWMGGESMRSGRETLVAAGIPTWGTPEPAVRAYMTLVDYDRNLRSLHQTPREIAVSLPADRPDIRAALRSRLGDAGRVVMSEPESKDLLARYGLPVAACTTARTEGEAVDAASRVGYPVVLKVLAPDVTHKSDRGGVRLDLVDAAAVRAAFRAIAVDDPDAAPASAVSVQPMVAWPGAIELIAGAKRDPVFGTVVMVGAGGTAAEVLADRSLGLPPLNEALAGRMLDDLRIRPLLDGWRGRPPVDRTRLVETIVRLSYLVTDVPEIAELDVNPLLAGPHGVVALDARILLEPWRAGSRSFDHLALRPYPEELVRAAALDDGTPITLRPIRPEDETMWMELLHACSAESIWARFGGFYPWSSHEGAVRYCFNDYDREIAIVAERADPDGGRRLLAVGRLVGSPDRRSAEYAVLVGDAWQGRGLGRTLTRYATEVADRWGWPELVATTVRENTRILGILRDEGWTVRPAGSGGIMHAHRSIAAVPATLA